MLDAFLIFVGAFGIVVILPIIAVELLRRNAVSGRVWFELAWVALFWSLYFAGAVAVTAILPNGLCDAPIVALNSDPCNSSRALIAFTWIPTAILLVYFFILAVFAIIHSKEDDKIWHAGVGSYTWFETKQCIRSAPSTPIMSRFAKKPPSFAVPKPRRPPSIFVQHRAGLGSNYEIEHFPDPGSLEEQPLPKPPVLPAKPPVNAMALYPQQVQASMMREVQNTQPLNVYRSNTGANGASEPPPVRDWPKQIGEERPSRERRNRDRAATTASASRSGQPQPPQLRPLMLGRSTSRSVTRSDKGKGRMTEEEQMQNEQTQTVLDHTNTQSSVRSYSSQKPPSQPLPPVPQTKTAEQRSRPTGPRSRSSSGEKHRPPPLDLTYSKPPARR